MRSLLVRRAASAALTMAYPGSLPFVLGEWQMTAVQGGLIQAAFNGCYAVSLLTCSLVANRLGATRIFRVANASTAIAMLLCAAVARSFESGLICFALLGLASGGSYAPALILAVERGGGDDGRRRAVGQMVAAASLGYFVAIATCAVMIPKR